MIMTIDDKKIISSFTFICLYIIYSLLRITNFTYSIAIYFLLLITVINLILSLIILKEDREISSYIRVVLNIFMFYSLYS